MDISHWTKVRTLILRITDDILHFGLVLYARYGALRAGALVVNRSLHVYERSTISNGAYLDFFVLNLLLNGWLRSYGCTATSEVATFPSRCFPQ